MIIHLIQSKSGELVWDAATKVIVNYKYIMYMSTKTKFNVIYYNHLFHSHSILKSTFQTPSTFPS